MTSVLHVKPVLSAADADVAVVMMESGRRGESTGGASILTGLGLRQICMWVGERFAGGIVEGLGRQGDVEGEATGWPGGNKAATLK